MLFAAGLFIGAFLGVSILCVVSIDRCNKDAWFVELAKAVLWSISKEHCWVESYLPDGGGRKIYTVIEEADIDKLLDAYRNRETKQEKENNNDRDNG